MGNVSIKRSLNLAIVMILLLNILLGGIGVVLIGKLSSKEIDYRRMRLDVDGFAEELSECVTKEGFNSEEVTNLINHSGYCGIILDLSGNILQAFGDTSYKIGESYPLRALAGKPNELRNDGQYEYVMPILNQNTQTNTLILSIPTAKYLVRNQVEYWFLLLILLAMSGSLILCIYLHKQLKSTIFEPIEQLTQATERILDGDLQTKLKYDYDDEIGSLCHDVEQLRDELYTTGLREKQLEDNKKLLLACISHDLKTPLSSISGYVEGIRDHVVKDDSGVKRYSEIILNKVHLLSKLIDDILEETKTELDQFSFEFSDLYCKEFFTEVYEELSLDVAKSGHELVVEEIPEYLLSIDKKRIRQAITNIVDNAVKYSKEGSKIKVSFFISELKERKELVTEITDSGIGISSGDLPFIFDKFYRGDRARTQEIPGSGLGLNIAKYIVEKHGGTIECDSVLNVGTTMMFSLPL